jgi:hypothetical protein
MANFSKMTSFLRKNRLFFKRVLPTLNSIFEILKKHLVVQRPKINQKISQRKFYRWRIFSKWHLYFFLIWKYTCVRKYPNDQFFWHNFFVCGYFSTNFSGFLHNRIPTFTNCYRGFTVICT